MNQDDDNCCFICLSNEASPELGALGKHCNCPSLFSHRSCLTRWQLQNAGKPEELECRFCHAQLLDWRSALTAVPSQYKRSAPIMAVVFQGKTIKVPVCTGPEGVADFKRTVCKLFNLPEGTDFEVTFECKSPVWGDKLHLKGFDCFEAASYCAAVSAAKRATHKAARAAAGEASAGTGTAPRGSGSGSRGSRAEAAQRHQSEASSPRPSPRARASNPLEGSSSGHSPASFVRRFLCGSANIPPRSTVDIPTTPAVPESPRTVSPAQSSGGSSSALSSAGIPGSDSLPLPAAYGPPAAHVATTSPGGGRQREAGVKVSKPLGASLSDLFRRMV